MATSNYTDSTDISKFCVEEWIELYRQSPEEFEAKRQAWIKQTIADASPTHRARLEGLQFTVDGMRATRKPTQMMVDLSKLMFERLSDLQNAFEGRMAAQPAECQVIAFNRKTQQATDTDKA